MSRVRAHVRTITVGVLLVALTGCGGGQGEDGPLAITADEANQQFREEAANWELPAGWEWPEEVFTGEGPDGAPAMYETSIGRIQATRYWYCAWSRTLIAADTEEARQEALTQVLRVHETPYYQVGLVDKGPTDERLAAAEVGDFSALAHHTELNCPEGSHDVPRI